MVSTELLFWCWCMLGRSWQRTPRDLCQGTSLSWPQWAWTSSCISYSSSSCWCSNIPSTLLNSLVVGGFMRKSKTVLRYVIRIFHGANYSFRGQYLSSMQYWLQWSPLQLVYCLFSLDGGLSLPYLGRMISGHLAERIINQRFVCLNIMPCWLWCRYSLSPSSAVAALFCIVYPPPAILLCKDFDRIIDIYFSPGGTPSSNSGIFKA